MLERYAKSASVAEIASSLSVSPNTVKSQIRSIYKKLGVSGRGAALARAVDLGILRSPASAKE
ncbi:helix-turn-helix transcriptional regulator [Leucobacter coleopterorum]|uniref:helix-turn-helix transcriptional regulator n=1 Tax=Leucobacter coleopterorum TaxID=2714933 RepID=UPI001FCB9231|nr:LuxR C-terminal-related transcriptional regulator [Leucobacter coleopterorum]